MTLVLQTRTKTEEDGRTQVNIFEILFRRLLGLAILRKANFPKLGRECQRQRIASVKMQKGAVGNINNGSIKYHMPQKALSQRSIFGKLRNS